MVTNVGPAAIDLSNGATIEVIVNSFRSVRGRTILAAILPIGGTLYKKIKDTHGKSDAATLAVMGSTLTFNPSFPQDIIDKALEDDPEKFGAEYLCRWRDDLSTFIDRPLLDAAVDTGVIVWPPVAGVNYIAACDAVGAMIPSQRLLLTGIGMALSFSMSHSSGRREYRCHKIVGDNYGAAWTVEAFAKAGARYDKSDRDRSAVYMDTLPIFTSGRARLIDNPKLISQFSALERRTFSTGRERIDPGPVHDDLCNSAAIALSLAAGKGQPMIITEGVLRLSAIPLCTMLSDENEMFFWN